MREVSESLKEELAKVRQAIRQNQSQQDSLQQSLLELKDMRDELQATLDFLKSRG